MNSNTKLTKKEMKYFLDMLWQAGSIAIITILEQRRLNKKKKVKK